MVQIHAPPLIMKKQFWKLLTGFLMPMRLPQDQWAAVRILQIVLGIAANPPTTQMERPTGLCR